MQEFDQLLEVLDTLLGPNGCPWDQKQTFESLRQSVLEEAHEVVDAVDHKDYPHLCEELGDLLLNVLFYGRIGEKEGHFTVKDTIKAIHEKLIRRHPHVFGEAKVSDMDELMAQWESIKRSEGKPSRVPSTLPALARAQSMIQKKTNPKEPSDPELTVAKKLWDVVEEAEAQGINAEHALLRYTKTER